MTPGSWTVVRLLLMHWTGMRPSQMDCLRPDDFRLDEPTPFVVVPRGKGGWTAGVDRVSDPPLVRDRASSDRIRRGRH